MSTVKNCVIQIMLLHFISSPEHEGELF